MPFPVTHLRVADRVAREIGLNEDDTAALLLGALAPDGVHYRAGFSGASQRDIGAAKKASHLCPPGDEPWGQVSDNDGWLTEVKKFLLVEQAIPAYGKKTGKDLSGINLSGKNISKESSDIDLSGKNTGNDFLSLGYAVHVLTDLYNNMTLWKNFRTNHPEEAAKGYASAYYREIPELDLELYQQEKMTHILQLLPRAVPRDFPGRVTAEEIAAIRAGIFAEESAYLSTYVGKPPADTSANRLVTSAMMREFVEGAVAFVLDTLGFVAQNRDDAINR